MIGEFIERFQDIKSELEQDFKKELPSNYEDILKQTLKKMFNNDDKYSRLPDYKNMTTIDDGDYQGTLLFIIPEVNYQPCTYWSIFVDYGSCSGCDTYEAYCDEVDGYKQMVTLALHMIQSMKIVGEEDNSKIITTNKSYEKGFENGLIDGNRNIDAKIKELEESHYEERIKDYNEYGVKLTKIYDEKEELIDENYNLINKVRKLKKKLKKKRKKDV